MNSTTPLAPGRVDFRPRPRSQASHRDRAHSHGGSWWSESPQPVERIAPQAGAICATTYGGMRCVSMAFLGTRRSFFGLRVESVGLARFLQ